MLARLPTAALFGTVAWLRGRHRALHPNGDAYEAEVELGPDAPAPLGPSRTVAAIARLSRGGGLPAPLPDVHGVAVKLPSLHGPGHDQDLLFATTWRRHVLRPVRRFEHVEHSTILPFELPGGRRVVFGALPDGEGRFALASAPVLGDWGEPWGELRLGRRLPAVVAEELRFDPFATAPGLRLSGPFSELRRPAYRASQAVRR
ncbi:MAG TPA: hypothetical protein VFR97_05465 [Capillimicrobium sp.]|nr:hypothetical protein [Capillimicrobium sp.]